MLRRFHNYVVAVLMVGCAGAGLFSNVSAAKPAKDEKIVTKEASSNSAQDTLKRLPISDLPKEGAIVWGNPKGKTVIIFSDFRCGYCRALSNNLRSLKLRVVERPIFALGSRALSNQVYCAKDKEKALHMAYAGEPLGNPGLCDTSSLDANRRFARKHGFMGIPVIVRPDGMMTAGYLEKKQILDFLSDTHG